jgi:hypothetical protein
VEPIRRVMVVAGALAAVVVAGSSQPALAACHSFSVSAAPEEVAEGGTVTVTVERDAGVAPSQVDVSAVAESATPGQDTASFNVTANFPDGGTSQSFPLAITDDAAVEGTETFRLHLSNPQGCAVNPSFRVGDDATVAIVDNDTAPPTTAPPTTAAPSTTAAVPTSTSSSSSTTVASSTSSSSSSTSSSSTSTTLVDEEAVAADQDDDDDGGGGGGVLLLLVAIAAVAGGIGYLLWRRAQGAPGAAPPV